eukprot:CAMPEP_0185797918 /NCGR_PEP_ID=MMETSP1174-20130828/161871_1 /TAXON_ID=35687 /ORGANISM="Dictyocha speculum, Strain CCMP1381" /LENGTH=194 /DNA_ID=CAMNT_0028493383 /DNA_START=547 /DNA_END=1131 /DNA_ORIENTATION=-
MNDEHTWVPVQKEAGVEGSYGCEQTHGHWDPFLYEIVQPTHSTSDGYTFPETDFTDVSFTVRSSSDPYVLAEKYTHGSLDFGMSSHDALVSAIVLVIIGVIVAIQPVCTLARWRSSSNEKALLEYDAVTRDEGETVDRRSMCLDDDESDPDSHSLPMPHEGSARKRVGSGSSSSSSLTNIVVDDSLGQVELTEV